MQTVCASGSNCLPQCVEGTSKVLIIRYSKGQVKPMRIQQFFMTKDSVVHVTCITIMYPRTFFFLGGGGGGGRDIEINQWPGSSDIDGQDQCEHMPNLVMVIAIF